MRRSGKARMRSAVTALSVAMLLAGGLPASATANPGASCVGIEVSTRASAGEMDVEFFKGLAETLGFPFGEFTSEGARIHGACIPPL